MKRKFIIDTDTASDDAVAILMALQSPTVDVEAITVVYGNVPLKQASINARYTVELCGAQTPVYNGCDRPLFKEAFHAEWFHGPDGMGDMNYPPPQRAPEPEHAVDELIRRFGEAPGEITLITLGPVTNVAMALRKEPRLAEWVKECYVMGGAACVVGNVTPAAEYNMWCDPEAAHMLFHSGMKIMMVGWEHCRGEALLDQAEMDGVYAFSTERARFAIDCNKHALDASVNIQHDAGLSLPDPVTMSIALDRTVCTRSSMHFVEVACNGPARGMTIVDEMNIAKCPPYKDPYYTDREPNLEVCWEIDARRWKDGLYRALRD